MRRNPGVATVLAESVLLYAGGNIRSLLFRTFNSHSMKKSLSLTANYWHATSLNPPWHMPDLHSSRILWNGFLYGKKWAEVQAVWQAVRAWTDQEGLGLILDPSLGDSTTGRPLCPSALIPIRLGKVNFSFHRWRNSINNGQWYFLQITLLGLCQSPVSLQAVFNQFEPKSITSGTMPEVHKQSSAGPDC
jgi:hypothetical protein